MSTEREDHVSGAAGDPPGRPDGAAQRQRRLALRKKIIAVCTVAGLCLGVVLTRAVWEGRSALTAGDRAAEQGDHDEAISRWRRAARWYAPGAPHVGRAYDRLENLARQAEDEDDIDTALAAWRGVRGSILATRSFYTPHEHRLEPANQRIAALMAALEARDPALAASGDSEAERTAWHHELLSQSESPSVPWSVIAILGFALWLGGGLLFALRGITPDDRMIPRTAAYAGIMIAAGLLLWMTGLYLA